jgi:hypothetical protein
MVYGPFNEQYPAPANLNDGWGQSPPSVTVGGHTFTLPASVSPLLVLAGGVVVSLVIASVLMRRKKA